jgi:hypothetical protein
MDYPCAATPNVVEIYKREKIYKRERRLAEQFFTPASTENPRSKETNTRAAAALMVHHNFRPGCVQGGPNKQSLRPASDFYLQNQHTHTAVIFIQLIS